MNGRAPGPSALDRWTIGYALVAVSAYALRWPAVRPFPWPVLLAHLALIALALGAGRARTAGGAGVFLGEFYPLLVLVALYDAIGFLNRAAGVFHDALVQRWDAALFGGQPGRDWIRCEPWPALSAALHAGYLSFYAIIAAAPLALWFSGRRAAARRTLLATLSTFYVCYAVFLVFPVLGPRYVFPPVANAATAVAPAVLANVVLDHGDALGTTFPSSHVAGAFVAAACAWRGWRRLGALLAPPAVLLAFGTVYGRFHYAVDALAGAALAALMLVRLRARRRLRAAGP